MIPFFNLRRQYAAYKDEIDLAIQETLEGGTFILGERVAAFEKAFAKYCGARHCISVGSGTDALNLSLKALGIGPGDEIIMPSHTFVATAFAAGNVSATPVFVDIDPQTYTIDPQAAKRALSPKTKAILPVHLYGQYADMQPLQEMASQKNIQLIEDACQSHGARYRGSRAVFGDLACYSFYPTKNLGCYGDGGAIVTDNEELAATLRLLRNYGQDKKYSHIMHGYNSRLDEIQAAILLAKLNHLDEWNAKRRKLAARYNKHLEGTSLICPKEASYNEHVYYLYAVRSTAREKLQAYLLSKGIETLIHYPIPIHQQKAFASYNAQKLPVTEQITKEILSLPLFPELSETETEEIAEAIRSFKA